jgi:hypothetical protein
MDDRHHVSTPKEGLGTLVAQFSFLHFDKAVHAARELRSKGSSEAEIREALKASYSDMDDHTRRKVHQVSLGLQPRDDILVDQILERNEIKSTTIEIKVSDCPKEVVKGTVVFVEKKRWVVISRQGQNLELKQF